METVQIIWKFGVREYYAHDVEGWTNCMISLMRSGDVFTVARVAA